MSKHEQARSHGLQRCIRKCNTVFLLTAIYSQRTSKVYFSDTWSWLYKGENTFSKALAFPYLIQRKYNYPQRQEMKQTWEKEILLSPN